MSIRHRVFAHPFVAGFFIARVLNPLAATLALTLVAATVALPPAADAQMGARTVPRNLAEMVNQAAIIVRGQVVEARLEPHPQYANVMTVVVTLRVQEVLKGSAGETFTFRQYIVNPQDRSTRMGYRTGESVLLLMHEASSLGFSSPVALDQGRFRITAGPGGTEMVANGWDNLGLLRNVRTTVPKLESKVGAPAQRLLEQHISGQIPYDQLKDLVRGLMAP
jgi:hypothetical protein